MRRLVIVLTMVTASGAAKAAEATVTLAVDNMTCAICPITVKAALAKVPGVRTVTVEFEGKIAVVTYDDAGTSVDELARASRNAGFPARRKE